MMKSFRKKWKSLQIAVIVFAMALMFAVPAVAAKTGPFSDVLSGKWYTQAVAYCAQKGYVSGYEDGSFRPNNKLTRAEMAVIMNKMLELTGTSKNSFKDVASGKWYTEAVLHCVKAGIMTGYSATVFGTTDTLTREQGAVILAKAFQVNKISGRTGFSDDASISKWAVESVKAMSAKGLITGMGDNQFAPKMPLTRAQMCQIIYAAQGKNGKEDNGESKPEDNGEKPSPNPAPADYIFPSGDDQQEIQVGDVEEDTTGEDWDTAQKDYQKEDDVSGSIKIDVDGDDELEMLTYGQDETGNIKLITYHQGKVSILPLNGASVAYVPRDNKILTAEYMDSTYYLTIYSIENGAWVKKSVGSFQIDEAETDEDGEFRFTNCQWDGKSVDLVEFFEIMAEKIDVENMIQINED